MTSYIKDPLAGWNNDDLMFSVETREFVDSSFPRILPILDWPQLRAQFAIHDVAAGAARRHSRRSGIFAGLIGYASLLIAGFMPLLSVGRSKEDLAPAILGSIAALLAVSSAIWGYSQVLNGRRKSEWLTNRYITERLRQLHFQFIINHLTLAVRVMIDPNVLGEWESSRARVLSEFVHRFVRPVNASMREMQVDDAEDDFWLIEDWNGRPPLPDNSPDLEELFRVLSIQRFEIQRRFADLKTAPGLFSSKTRSQIAKWLSEVLTLLALASVAVGGGLLVFGYSHNGWAVAACSVFGAVCTATIVFVRVLNEGLQLSSEAERYTWYKAAVEGLAQRFSHSSTVERIDTLREMERLSYQEMRWFMISFRGARFIF